MIISVLSILLCIVALCSVTFCWYTGETKSDSNTLISGNFDLTVSVTSPDETILVAPYDSREGVLVCQLPAEGTYTVILELKPGSTAKGHCIVTVGNDNPRHTAAIIGADTANSAGSTLTSPFIFTITVTKAQIVTLEPRWGIVVEPDIAYEGTYPTATE